MVWLAFFDAVLGHPDAQREFDSYGVVHQIIIGKERISFQLQR